jgi:hypothetical protein
MSEFLRHVRVLWPQSAPARTVERLSLAGGDARGVVLVAAEAVASAGEPVIAALDLATEHQVP